MAVPTKQEIIDRRAELAASGSKAAAKAREAYEAAVGAEVRSLQELCGADGQGHIFAKPDWPDFFEVRRVCVFCHAVEPREA